jgi:molecular chaperone GrpE
MAEEKIDQEKLGAEEPTAAQAIPVKVKIKESEEPLRVTDRRFWVQPEGGKDQEETRFSLKPTYVEELEKKLSDSQKKLDEVIASYREFKAEAGLETRKARERIQSEYDKRLTQAKGNVANKFIEVSENLDRAIAASDEAQNFQSLLEGVKLIRNQFSAALADLGLEEIAMTGEPFNPEIAEAIQTVEVEDEAEDNTVLEVVRKGYRMNDFLVRPAQVIVGKSKAPLPEAEASLKTSPAE